MAQRIDANLSCATVFEPAARRDRFPQRVQVLLGVAVLCSGKAIELNFSRFVDLTGTGVAQIGSVQFVLYNARYAKALPPSAILD